MKSQALPYADATNTDFSDMELNDASETILHIRRSNVNKLFPQQQHPTVTVHGLSVCQAHNEPNEGPV
jgi:hypothetical protein